MKLKQAVRIMLGVVSITLVAALGSTQVVVKADFVTAPSGVGNPFTVMVGVTGSPTVSGYNFRIGYDGIRCSLNSGVDQWDPAGYNMDIPINTSIGNTLIKDLPTDRYRAVQGAYSSENVNAANLVLLNFTQLTSGPIDVAIVDNDAHGLEDSGFTMIPHTFMSNLPVAISAFELE